LVAFHEEILPIILEKHGELRIDKETKVKAKMRLKGSVGI